MTSPLAHRAGPFRVPACSAVPVPPGVRSPQTALSDPLPELPALGSSPPSLRPGSPRLGSRCHHSALGDSHLRPAVTTPGPAVAASSRTLVPESLSRGLSPGGPAGRVYGAGSGCAQPPPAASESRPTLRTGPRRPAPHQPSRGRRRCCCPRCGSCQGWPIAPDCAERAPPHLLSPPAPCLWPRPHSAPIGSLLTFPDRGAQGRGLI